MKFMYVDGQVNVSCTYLAYGIDYQPHLREFHLEEDFLYPAIDNSILYNVPAS